MTETDFNPLLSSMEDLSEEARAPAIALARKIGGTMGAGILPAAAPMLLGGGDAVVEPITYVAAAVEAGPMMPEDSVIEAWQEAFESGEAMQDPRVQAFVSAFREKTSSLGVDIRERRALLARHLEVGEDEVETEPSSFLGHLVYVRTSGRVQHRGLVLREEEADEIAKRVLFRHLHEVDTERLLPALIFPESHAWMIDRLREDLGEDVNPVLQALLRDEEAFWQEIFKRNGRAGLLLGDKGDLARESRFQGFVIYEWAERLDEGETVVEMQDDDANGADDEGDEVWRDSSSGEEWEQDKDH